MSLTFQKIASAIAATFRGRGVERREAYLTSLVARARRAVERGKLADAEACCEYVLRLDPAHGGALECRGAVAARRAAWNEAIEYLERAIHASPARADLYRQLAEARQHSGDLGGAMQSLREALRIAPDTPTVLARLAHVHLERHEGANALASASRALEREPEQPLALRVYGKVLLQRGDIHGALTYLRRAAEAAAVDASAWGEVGTILRALSQLNEARDCYERAIALDPTSPELHVSLGDVFLAADRLDEATSYYKEALRIAPELPKALSRMALVTTRRGELKEAERLLLQVRDLAPGDIESLIQLGLLYQNESDRQDDALECYRRARALDPIRPEAHLFAGLIQLSRGELQEGWQEHEWRLRLPAYEPLKEIERPLWTAQDPAGRTILVQREPGLRNAVQFIRYASLLAERGARVVVDSGPEMKQLATRVRGVERVIGSPDEMAAAAGSVDLRCPMLSLPHRFGTTLESIPATVPYLFSDSQKRAVWQARIDKLPTGRKVGVNWSIPPESAGGLREAERSSIPVAELTALLRTPGVAFVSLQPAGDILADTDIVDWTAEVTDFDDLASLIATLDLVISVDTVVAHLAGAMGKPVWILLPHAAEWRWMRDTETSPWYPTARLFRQRAPGDWRELVGRVVAALGRGELPR